MFYTIPDYYQDFHCVADACEDTCCAGWQIVVDEKSLNRYKREAGPYRKKLRRSIRWRQKVFCQDKEKRCAFLTEENLCQMYQNLGEKSLCKTCRLYPRHIEEFEGVRVISLSLSCPEVAGMLLERKEKVTFRTVERDGEEEFESFDPFLYSKLLDARDVIIGILQNRKLPIENRILMSLGLAWDMENRVNSGKLFGCDAVFETYKKQTWFSAAGRKTERSVRDMRKRLAFSRKMFGNLRELELLREDWEHQLNEAEILLFAYGEDGYRKIQDAFSEWIASQCGGAVETQDEGAPSGMEMQDEGSPSGMVMGRMQPAEWDWDIFCEQLMVYFIFTYFCGAVYDGRIFVNVQMAAASVSLIWDLMAVRWLKNEKSLDAEDVKEIVYRFSRELEHSDKNLKRFWRILETQKELFR